VIHLREPGEIEHFDLVHCFPSNRVILFQSSPSPKLTTIGFVLPEMSAEVQARSLVVASFVLPANSAISAGKPV